MRWLELVAIVVFLIPLGAIIFTDWLVDGLRLYEFYGAWGILLFLAVPVIVAVGGYFMDDYRR